MDVINPKLIATDEKTIHEFKERVKKAKLKGLDELP